VQTLVLALSAFWLLVPSSVRPAIDANALLPYPLTRRQRFVYRLITHLFDWKPAVLAAASLLTILASLRLPDPVPGLLAAAGCLGGVLLAGLALALASESFAGRVSARRLLRRRPRARALPLLRKEAAYFLRTLDPWSGFAIAVVAGFSQAYAAWMSPAKAAVPLLLIAAVQLPAVLNPFALNGAGERDRYRILPLPFGRILAVKHGAALLVLVGSQTPLLLALLWRQSGRDAAESAALTALIAAGYLLAGAVLSRLRATAGIQAHFGAFSGEGLSLDLYAVAVAIAAAPAVAALVAARLDPAWPALAVEAAVLLPALALHSLLLRRRRWPEWI
jgi:hypothetical protein